VALRYTKLGNSFTYLYSPLNYKNLHPHIIIVSADADIFADGYAAILSPLSIVKK